jgi:hypothetical protein
MVELLVSTNYFIGLQWRNASKLEGKFQKLKASRDQGGSSQYIKTNNNNP